MSNLCLFCGEGFEPGDNIRMIDHLGATPEASGPRAHHLECLIRNVMGSVGHQKGQCRCYGQIDRSEEGMTVRQAAKAALLHYRRTHTMPANCRPERN